jgi:oxygen-independent coproporphyrinogen III oxidase
MLIHAPTVDNQDEKGLVISSEQIKKYDVAGPRYTSYPTADRFVDAFNAECYNQTLALKNLSASPIPLSMYIHIPFCESLCFYCACNKIITKQHQKGAEYIQYLKKEIALHVEQLGVGNVISQLHFGGGSPTFFSDNELSELMEIIKRNFVLPSGGEYSIEIDPRTVDEKRLTHLASLGFNRISFGVQDFDFDVQKAVHRIQPAEQVFDLVKVANTLHFDSVNVDLIYGLPKQSARSFKTTLNQVVALKPDRIALYAYAHLPERFKPQRRISQYALPTANDKIDMLSDAIKTFIDAGYVYIGMDHFALPNDTLSIAKKQGRLHRNFQGYSTQADCDLIALGVSAIGRIGSTYSQNAKTLEDYYDALDQGQFPIIRGLSLTRDDLIRRAVIMAIMCHGELQYESIELSYMIDFKSYFSHELQRLQDKADAGMLIFEADGFKVTEIGWFFVRAVAMEFDRYLQEDVNRARFSKII